MIDKYLPVGSVVLLKNGRKRLIINGFQVSTGEKTFDYLGSFYPEGIISFDKLILFNHSDIDAVFFTGYRDEEQRMFNDKLKDTDKEDK